MIEKALSFSILATYMLMASPASAHRDLVIIPSPPAQCASSRIQLCGDFYQLGAAPVGGVQSVHLPERYVLTTATFQCVNDGWSAYHKLVNGDVASCEVKKCAVGTVTLCGMNIPVMSEAAYGDTTSVAVPLAMLDRNRATTLTLNARCESDTSGAAYKALPMDSLFSCNVFLCPPARLRACDANVDVTESAPMGQLVNVVTELGQPVEVSCVGTVDGAPRFTVTYAKCNR